MRILAAFNVAMGVYLVTQSSGFGFLSIVVGLWGLFAK